jgi:O-antigen/teichoic acid export membrane protein
LEWVSFHFRTRQRRAGVHSFEIEYGPFGSQDASQTISHDSQQTMSGIANSSDGRRQTMLVLGDQIIVSGANFAAGLILARFLGPDGFGQFVLAYNIILFVSGIQIALIISPMMVIGPTLTKERRQEYYTAVLLQQLLCCAVFGVAILATGHIANHFVPQWGLESLLWALIFAMFGFICQDFSRRYLFVRDSAGAALANDLITHGLKVALLAGLGVTVALNVKNAFWIVAFASAAGTLLAIMLSRSRHSLTWPGYSALSRVNYQHWNFGKWLLANSIIYWSSSQLIIYMAGAVISAAAVGNISAALNVVGAANILFLAMENLVPSRAARMYALRGQDGLTRYLRRVIVRGGFGTLSLVAVAGYWSEFWLELFYGTAYKGAGWIVIWSGVFYFLGFFQRPLSIGLRVLGNTRAIFFASLVGAIVAILVSYPAIRWAGVAGVMFALCLVQTAVMITMWVCYKRTTGALQPEQPSDTGAMSTALVSPTNMKEMP